MNCNLPGSFVLGISQARILKWGAISFSRGSYQPRDQTSVSWNFCTGGWILYHSANLRSSCSMDYWKVKSFPKADFHFSVKGTVESISGQWKKWKRGMCFGERFSTPIKRVRFVRKPCSPIPAWGCVPVEQLQLVWPQGNTQLTYQEWDGKNLDSLCYCWALNQFWSFLHENNILLSYKHFYLFV